MVHLAMLTLRFHLEGCASLKDKRQRLNGLRDRFGRMPGIAVCESDLQDSLHQAEWTFVALAGSRKLLDQLIADVETHVAETLDARVAARELEYL
jgi:uncharacterized protein YlxP (DUF503 family)